jgi:hypothetical protein
MMRLMTALSCFLLLSILCSSAAAYRGSKDRKPVAELELMDDGELRWEMMSVCLSVAIYGPLEGPGFRLDGIRYAQLIERVSRKQHGGKSQKVMLDLLAATADGSQQQCEQAHNAFLEEVKKGEKPRKSRNP